ncbi:hypothetical protein AB8Z38_34935 [Bradyrhizobium sp. LLZ17]|uniref:Fimbrial protein n=1 Tax=Bradyrhizobium sp. LLZ17 TaxID=3239388 RepID=A0AB39XLB6_9BRAD
MDTGRLNHHVEDDLSRTLPPAVAHPPADDHVAEDRETQPFSDRSDSAPIIHPPQEAPALSSATFDSGVTAIAMWMQRARRIWRGHLQREQLPELTARPIANIERWLLALLSVVVIVICVSATIVFMQVKSLKADIAILQRDIIALKLRVARLDQIASANEARDKPSSEIPKPPAETRPDRASLNLSREEIQLIRDYIKPAPIAGSATESIKVGDPITGPTIPFPSPVTEKVRKLIGARFAIRNGTIIIVSKDSRQADAVLGPN